MSRILFVKDGYVFTNAIRRYGKLVFKANGGFFRFPLYAKKIDENEEDQVTTT